MNKIGEVLLGSIFTTSDTQHWLIPVLLVLAMISWFLWKQSKKRLRHIFFLGLFLSLIGVTVKSTTVVSSTLSDLFTNNETTTTSGSAAKKKQAAKKAALKKQLLAAWQSVGQEYTSQYSIAILNADGQEVSYTTTDSTFSTASIVKVSIAAQLLHNNGTTQTTLSTTQANLLTAMIENSDNDAATSLLTNDLGGYSSLSSTYQALDMNDTTANADAWGYTQTTAEDQIKLLSTIFGTADYLTTNSQDYLQSLMNTISADQAWGISQGATNCYLKNGWLQDEDGWMVNSIGKVELGDDESYLIAILTKENTTFEEGQTLIEALTEQTNSVLSSSDE